MKKRTPLIIALIVGLFLGYKGAFYFKPELKTDLTPALETETAPLSAEETVDLDLFWQVWELLEENYVDETVLNDQDQVYGAVRGMVESLDDPYTTFMAPEETKAFQDTLEGNLEGIGAELTVKNGYLVIVSPLKNSPAEKAGLKPGDIVYQIEGEVASEMTLFEAIMKIRGEKGTPLNLTIVRENDPNSLEITIVRDEIQVQSVSWEEMGENEDIAYINVYQFNDSTEQEFKKVVGEILLSGIKGVILDLRYNGGGYLDIAVDMISEFLEGKKKAVLIKHRDEEKNQIIYTSGNARLPEIPLVVLVNNGSASASEIVAGAIQDYNRGLILGESTFGKGNVQEIDLLEDGSSLRITVARWYTPSGRSIDEVGITPDRLVELTEEDWASDYDRQLQEAIKYLEGF